jgi:RNA polymerase sigma-70 factor (ECF subfamily)
VLAALMPDEPEVRGLLALILLHDARRASRVEDAGYLVPLEEQDRTRWDRDRIGEAVSMLDAAVRRGRPGPFQVQAAIAACHATASDAAATDWRQIASLYGQLARLTPTPIVALNQAVAVAMADGPDWPRPATRCVRRVTRPGRSRRPRDGCVSSIVLRRRATAWCWAVGE